MDYLTRLGVLIQFTITSLIQIKRIRAFEDHKLMTLNKFMENWKQGEAVEYLRRLEPVHEESVKYHIRHVALAHAKLGKEAKNQMSKEDLRQVGFVDYSTIGQHADKREKPAKLGTYCLSFLIRGGKGRPGFWATDGLELLRELGDAEDKELAKDLMKIRSRWRRLLFVAFWATVALVVYPLVNRLTEGRYGPSVLVTIATLSILPKILGRLWWRWRARRAAKPVSVATMVEADEALAEEVAVESMESQMSI